MATIDVELVQVAHNEGDFKSSTRKVYRSVAFRVDGMPLADLVSRSFLGDCSELVTPFYGIDDARSILLGQRPYADWMPDDSRLPILTCQCGDLACGTVTARFERDDEAVTWSDWKWETFYEDGKALPELEDCRFDAAQYQHALGAAEGLAPLQADPVTVMRVKYPTRGWRNRFRSPSNRTSAPVQLGWLMAEAVTPRIAEAEGTYFEFLASLDEAQALLVGVGGAVDRLADDARAQAHANLTYVCDSVHSISLPGFSLDAARWFLQRVS